MLLMTQRQNLKMMSDKGDDEGGDDALDMDMGDEEKEDEAFESLPNLAVKNFQ